MSKSDKELEDIIRRLIKCTTPLVDYDVANQPNPKVIKVVGFRTRVEERKAILELPIVKEILERNQYDTGTMEPTLGTS